MAGPWEDYAPAASSVGPWTDYGGAASPKSSLAPSGTSERFLGAYEPPPAAPRSDGLFGNILGGIAEPIAAMGTGMVAKPVSELAGLGTILSDAVGATDRVDPMQIQQRVQQAMTYQPKTAAGQSQVNPLNLIPMLLGKAIDWTGNQAGEFIAPPGSEEGRQAFGRGVREAVEQAPQFLGLKAPGAAAAVAPVVKGTARDLMQSALKPDLVSRRTGKAEKAVDTLLDEGINVTKGGAEKMTARVDDLNQRIAALVENSPTVINKEAVSSRLAEKVKDLESQVTPQADLAALQRNLLDFMDHPLAPKKEPPRVVESAILDESGKPFTKIEPGTGTDTIPVQAAQKMKQGTYQALGEKSYGELKGADIEGQKALARGLKEEIAAKIPEVRPLNAEESRLLGALSLVERRILQDANKNPLGLGWLAGSKAHLAGWMADRSNLFKSLVARMLNTTAEALPGAAQRYGAPSGLLMNPGAAPTGPAPQQ